MNTSVTRKKFLLSGSVAAVGALLGRGLLHAQPGVSSPVPSASPSSKDVPDFPEHDPQIDRARVYLFRANAGIAALAEVHVQRARTL